MTRWALPRLLVFLLTVSAFAFNTPVSASAQGSSPDPRIGPHAADEALHSHEAVSLPPSRSAIQPLSSPRFSAATPGAGAVASQASPFHREVLGFAPYWGLNKNSQWDFRLLSTIAYFGLTINRDGNFDTAAPGWGQWSSQDLTDIINKAHSAGDKVVVVIKDFDTESINRVVTDPALTQVAINNTISKIAEKNLDGVNVDFEGRTGAPYIYIQSGMTSFMTKLSQQVHARWPNAEVSIDTYAASAATDDGLFKIGDVAPVVDALFVMAYDSVFSNQHGQAGANAPLTGYTYNDTVDVAQYLAKAPASKVLLGMPFYGYKWFTTGNGANASVSPARPNASSDTYANIVGEFACNPLYLNQAWDSYTQTPWKAWYSPLSGDPCGNNYGSWRELYYDDAQSLGLKYDLINQNNLRGGGFWALGYEGGATEIWNGIAQKLTTVTPWDTLGGSTTSDTGAASWGTSRLDVLVRNGYNSLSHNAWDGTHWLGWEYLGGSLGSSPDAVSGTANRVDTFVRTFDGAVYHKQFDGTTWLPWESLGGNVASGPSAASWGAGRLDVFVVGVDAAMWHRVWDGTTWQPWESLGGVVSSDPASVAWGVNRLDVFVRGTDNRLYHKAWTPAGWAAWEGLGGDIVSNPAVASCAAGKLDVFVVGSDRGLWRRGWNGTAWGPWVAQGGQWAGGPSAVCRPGMTVIEVFERGQDTGVWHTTVAST